ncbi:hypothetical protein GUJ93_ZPchr0009g1355 [Zizania palustris]|uniref:Uncharacterized protein n=1 Tax=Zizania palustris TaxID=103762 RepID=A0A8J5RPE3_ZIZPA|nr:hypothetical protein GUJ93_ZPchr0009g1355 [Zizania palustris]
MFVLPPLFPSSRDSSRGPLLRASPVRHIGARPHPSSSPLVATLSLPPVAACSATIARRGISFAILVAFRHQPATRSGPARPRRLTSLPVMVTSLPSRGVLLRRGLPSPVVVAGRLVSAVVEPWRPLRPSPPSRRSLSSRVTLSPPSRRLLRPSPPSWRSLSRVAPSPPSRRPSDLGVGPQSTASRGSPPAVAGVLPSAVIAAYPGRLPPPPPVGSASAVRHRLLLRCLPPVRLVLTSYRRRGGLLRRLGSGVVFFVSSPSLQDLISAVAGWSSCTVGCWLIPVTRVLLCHPRCP